MAAQGVQSARKKKRVNRNRRVAVRGSRIVSKASHNTVTISVSPARIETMFQMGTGQTFNLERTFWKAAGFHLPPVFLNDCPMQRFRFLARASLAMSLTLSPLAAATAQQEPSATDQPLAAYKNKNRVLLVFAPTEKDAAYVEQGKLWQGEKAGFSERQLVVVPVLADGKKVAGDTPAALEKKYGVDAKAFAVVLLGKDGHDAYRATKPVKAAALYEVIDAMPMRRAEMKRQQGAHPSKPDTDHDE